jgi:hypothetical protein
MGQGVELRRIYYPMQGNSPYRCKPAGIPRIPVVPVAAGTGLHRCVQVGVLML